jgi:glycosyltransferase involved in cell wall biosynthesis
LVGSDDTESPEIACLLPVRNAAHLLPGYLESAAQFADAVVALDDGSTDDTRVVLQAHPLVRTVLTNRQRDTYLGWHDGGNRNRLLAAAGELQPRWIFWLDADERLDPSDAAALRDFVKVALPGCVYGLRVFRMDADERYDPDYELVYRLFRYKRGQQLPHNRIDFTPVPNDIPARAWINTTLRIKHYGDIGAAGRDARLAKYRETDPEGRYAYYYEQFKPSTLGPYPRWYERDPKEPVIALGDQDRGGASPGTPLPRRGPAPKAQKLVCLLAARNCEADVAEWLDSVRGFADAVVALDDGSTDGTAAALAADGLVDVVLRNPVRAGFGGWDDAANRNQLLQAAAALEPDWIMSLDADERMTPDDAAALRRFVETEAHPGFGYGMPVMRMIGDRLHYDREENFGFRLFRYEPGQRFPDERLHLVPIPVSIPPKRWVLTSIRIQHLGSLTDELRSARRAKYAEADPNHEWEPDYSYTVERPGPLLTWLPRRPDEPLIADQDENDVALELALADLDLEGPVLTVVVLADAVAPDSTAALLDRLRSEGDTCSFPIEILVVASGPGAGEGVNGATVVEVAPGTPIGAAMNAAMRAARGDYALFVDGDTEVSDGAFEALVAAHDEGFAMVAGTVRNRMASTPGWAAYFLDQASSLPGGSEGELTVAPARCSFARDALLAAGGFDEAAATDVEARAAARLLRDGHRATRRSVVTFGQPTGDGSAGALLRRQFDAGRALGDEGFGAGGRRWRLARGSVRARGDLDAAFRRAVPLVVGGTVALWAGAGYERARGAAERLGARLRG